VCARAAVLSPHSVAMLAQVEAAWLKILRLAKVDSLRRDAEVLAQSHEREVDRRDALLQMLDADLDNSEEQFQQAVRDHLRALDKLIEIQDDRLADVERSFRTELATVEEEFERERIALEAAHAEETTLSRATLATIREREEVKSDRARALRDQQREELRNAASDRMEELARTMDEEIATLERAFEQAHVE
jgi:dynein regulatory complex subunit 2